MNEGDGTAGQESELLGLLRQAVARDEVPADVVAAAKAAFTWRTIDAELAELAYDSFEELAPLAGVRGSSGGAGGPRALTFEAGDAVIEVEVEESAGARRLEGQIVPADVHTLELHRLDTPEPVRLVPDELGRFRAEGLRPGRLRLLCRFGPLGGGATLLTAWVLI